MQLSPATLRVFTDFLTSFPDENSPREEDDERGGCPVWADAVIHTESGEGALALAFDRLLACGSDIRFAVFMPPLKPRKGAYYTSAELRFPSVYFWKESTDETVEARLATRRQILLEAGVT